MSLAKAQSESIQPPDGDAPEEILGPGCAFCAPTADSSFFSDPCHHCVDKASEGRYILETSGLLNASLQACSAFFSGVDPRERTAEERLLGMILYSRRYKKWMAERKKGLLPDPSFGETSLWQATILFIYLTVHRQGDLRLISQTRRILSDAFNAAVDFHVRVP